MEMLLVQLDLWHYASENNSNSEQDVRKIEEWTEKVRKTMAIIILGIVPA